MNCCNYTIKVTFIVSFVATLMHHLQKRPGNPFVRGSYAFGVCATVSIFKQFVMRYPRLEAYAPFFVLAVMMVALTEQGFFLSPHQF